MSARDEINAGDRFAFGDNWARFLKLVDERRIADAEESLREFLGLDDLKGKSFVDVGSGSGLFSLAAHRLGADVTSFDFDPQSVACTVELRRRYGQEDRGWQVQQGSALDLGYLGALGRFDIVYSWGVLHHTGRQWEAIQNAASLVAPGGLLFIALYNDQGRVSDIWTAVKRRYNSAGPAGKRVIMATVGSFLDARGAVIDRLKRRPLRRGMDRRRDILDWVGGWPFEVSTPQEVTSFVQSHGFTAVKSKTVGRRMGNNEFLFTKSI